MSEREGGGREREKETERKRGTHRENAQRTEGYKRLGVKVTKDWGIRGRAGASAGTIMVCTRQGLGAGSNLCSKRRFETEMTGIAVVEKPVLKPVLLKR